MKKTYCGSCHCGAVRFSCGLDLAPEGQRSKAELDGVWWTTTFRCNCSYCMKTRFWKAFVRAKDFALLAGDDALAEYQFAGHNIHYLFCRNCGIHPFSRADFEFMGGEFYAINVACLDDATDAELGGGADHL